MSTLQHIKFLMKTCNNKLFIKHNIFIQNTSQLLYIIFNFYISLLDLNYIIIIEIIKYTLGTKLYK